MKKFLFPLNFDYSSKFLGIFEYKILIPFCVFGFIFGYGLSLFNFSLIIKINIFIIVYFPLFLLANTKIFNESLISFLFCIIKHYIIAGIYQK